MIGSLWAQSCQGQYNATVDNIPVASLDPVVNWGAVEVVRFYKRKK